MNFLTSRNYILYPVQTNLELCNQMHEMGYSNEDISSVHEAYLFDMDKVYKMYRGSGKPFINHLVGVAGYMVMEKQHVSIIQTALLHALYQNRVCFGNNISLEDKRSMIKQFFGDQVDQLLWDYTQFELIAIDQINMDELLSNKEVLMLRIADEIEDLSTFGIMYHGKEDDTADVVGSALWRKNIKIKQVEKLSSICSMLGLNNMKQALDYWCDFNATANMAFSVKTGFYSSVTLE